MTNLGRATLIGLCVAVLPPVVGGCESDAEGGGTPEVAAPAPDAGEGEVEAPDAADVPAADEGPAPDVPAPAVEYAVGYLELTVTTPAGRELPVGLWYPAAEPGGAEPHTYQGVFPGTGFLDAEPAEGGPFPLIAFSHGSGGLKEQSLFLTEGLAREGYVVVAPDHVGNTVLTFDPVVTGELSLERPRDITAVLDRLASPEAEDPAWLGSKIDMTRVGAAGHSYGGYTTIALSGATVEVSEATLAACEGAPPGWPCGLVNAAAGGPHDLADPRIKAAVPMSPAGLMLFEGGGLADVGIPVLVLTGEQDLTTPLESTVRPIWEGLPAPKWLWTLEGGNHYAFADFCAIADLIPPGYFPAEMAETCEPDAPLPIDLAHALTFDVVLSFFDHYLRGDAEAIGALAEEAAEAAHPRIDMTVVLE